MKYQVKVTIAVEKTYTYEIDASKESKAQDAAFDKAVDEFRADYNSKYAFSDLGEFDTEQLTQECEDCGREYPLGTAEAWKEDQDFCAECGAKIEAAEKEKEVGA